MTTVTTVPAASITQPHAVTDTAKLNIIAASMTANGWLGRPVLAEIAGDGYQAWTGSHRIAAARVAGVAVPVVVISRDLIDAYLDQEIGETDGLLIDRMQEWGGIDDDVKLHVLRQVGDAAAIDAMASEISEN